MRYWRASVVKPGVIPLDDLARRCISARRYVFSCRCAQAEVSAGRAWVHYVTQVERRSEGGIAERSGDVQA
jgi:hypothetical protein